MNKYKVLLVLVIIAECVVLGVAWHDLATYKPVPPPTMPTPASVNWVGLNNHTYVKSAGMIGGAQDYGVLPRGSVIVDSTVISDPTL